MNDTTESCSLTLFYGPDLSWVANVVSLCIHLPANVYILQLILSQKLATVEFFPLNIAISEIFINLYDVFKVVTFFSPFRFIITAGVFLLGLIFTSRPLFLMLICVERYLAVAKPLFFMRFKHIKYKLTLSVLVWLLTVLSGFGIVLLCKTFYYIIMAEILTICVLKLYCCVATLYILKKPGPGEKVDSRGRLIGVKQKAFRIIFFITLSVILIYFPFISILLLARIFSNHTFMKIQSVCIICCANSGFIHSLIFLYRYDKLPFLNFVKSLQ